MSNGNTDPKHEEVTSYAIHNGALYKEVESPLFCRYALVEKTQLAEIEENELFTWKKARISFALWEQVVSFMKWSQKEFQSEAHCSLFYNLLHDTWAAWAFPQETLGMTVKLLPEDPVYKEQRKYFPTGWILAGSVHHHCESSAFQSGTDSGDECTKDGVHVTVGKTSSNPIALHVRKTLEGLTTNCTMDEFFEQAPWMDQVPKALRPALGSCFIHCNEMPFPDEWKHNVRKPVFLAASHPGIGLMRAHQEAQTLIRGGSNNNQLQDWLNNRLWSNQTHHEAYNPKKTKDPLACATEEMLAEVDEAIAAAAAYIGTSQEETIGLWLAFKNGEKLAPEELEAAKIVHGMLDNVGLRNKTIRAYLQAGTK